METHFAMDASNNASFNSSLSDAKAGGCLGTSENNYRDYRFLVPSIVLNLLACPPTVLLNMLVIVVVSTKPSLQTKYHLILASMAGTDLAVGIAVQPVFITGLIYHLVGGSPLVFCNIIKIPLVATASLSLASLFHLMLIGIERVVAMKYSFQYDSILKKKRLIVASVTCWLASIVHFAVRFTEKTDEQISGPALFILIATFMSVIFYCHISVYVVCRRHLKQIKSEQVSGEATGKFLSERKAWKTTTIVLGGLLLSFVPGLLRGIVNVFSFPLPTSVAHVTLSFIMLNSFFNPIVYCWRSKIIRQALMVLNGTSAKELNN